MKKASLLILSLCFVIVGNAQVTTLSENFNISCATVGPNYPLYWSEWHSPYPSALAWGCTPLGGRDGTPGIQCNSYISGVHYQDTAWLFTPQLNLAAYTDSVYLRFDSRYDISGAKMAVLVNNHHVYGGPPDSVGVPSTWTDVSNRLTPVIGPGDSVGWVTHYVNITQYKNSPLYVAFRYSSSITVGGSWTIDNVMTTPWGLAVDQPNRQTVDLTILGNSTTNTIDFSCTLLQTGNYQVELYDNLGRIAYKGSIYTRAGAENHSLKNLSLHAGMYLLKVGNDQSYGIIKTIVE